MSNEYRTATKQEEIKMMAVDNKTYEISVERLAAVIINATNRVAEISELLYYAKHEE